MMSLFCSKSFRKCKEFLQLDVKIHIRLETCLQGFKDDFNGETRSKLNTLRSELLGSFEQYFQNPIVSSSIAIQDRGKRVKGSRPLSSFPPKGPLEVPQSPIVLSLLNS